MTSPEKDPRRNWLLRYIGVQEKYDHLIATSLRDAADDAADHILKLGGKDTISSAVRRYQLQLARKAIKNVIKVLFRDLVPVIEAGQNDAVLAAVDAGFSHDAQVMRRLFPNASEREDWQDSFRQTASRNVQSMMKRIFDTQQPLSTRVYRTGALSNGSVDRIINSGLARGLSVGELARGVRDSIRPDTPGGVGYAAKRLARTEINNAYHGQAIDDVRNKPWVEYVEWRLSGSHPKSDPDEICEQYARAGRWDKNRVPNKPHPNCLCYIVPVLTDYEEFERRLLLGDYDQFLRQS